jgi:hypothetical protein
MSIQDAGDSDLVRFVGANNQKLYADESSSRSRLRRRDALYYMA